jgi:hypothetical protein
MSITIESAVNGWYLIHSEEGEPDQVYVFNGEDGEQSEVEAFRDLLATIDTLYGPSTSRYSEHRIYIRIEPGDKHSSHPDNQEDTE